LEQELLKDHGRPVRPGMELGEETYILCCTAGRKEKKNPFEVAFPPPGERLEASVETGQREIPDRGV
jgi:hypothetical protein